MYGLKSIQAGVGQGHSKEFDHALRSRIAFRGLDLGLIN